MILCLTWIILEAEPSTTIWLGPWCIWTPWLVSFRSSSRLSNGKIHQTTISQGLDVQTQPHEVSTPLSPSLLPPHLRHYFLMGAFRPTWSSIENHTYARSRSSLHQGQIPITITPKGWDWLLGNPSSTPAGKSPRWWAPGPEYPRATTRTTTPVPVRSKQRARPVDAPPPRTKQRVDSSAPDSAADPPPLPVTADSPPPVPNSDDLEEELPPRYRTTNLSTTVTSTTTTTNPVPTPTPPPGTSTTSEPINRSIEPGGNPPWFHPWTDAEDKELVSLKNDTRSRPSWKTIGARLRRDPQACKMRWTALKQMPEHQHRELPSHEPEAED